VISIVSVCCIYHIFWYIRYIDVYDA
jgi:hypothetical protein